MTSRIKSWPYCSGPGYRVERQGEGQKERNFISESVIEYVEGLIDNPSIPTPPFDQNFPYWAALANLDQNSDAYEV